MIDAGVIDSFPNPLVYFWKTNIFKNVEKYPYNIGSGFKIS